MSALDQLLLNRYRDQTPDAPTPLPAADQVQSEVTAVSPKLTDVVLPQNEQETRAEIVVVSQDVEAAAPVPASASVSVVAAVLTAAVEPVEEADLTPVNLDVAAQPAVNGVTPVTAESVTLEIKDDIVSGLVAPNSGADAVEALLEEVLLGQPSVRSHRVIPAVVAEPTVAEPYIATTFAPETPVAVATEPVPTVKEPEPIAVADVPAAIASDASTVVHGLAAVAEPAVADPVETAEEAKADEDLEAVEDSEASLVEESDEMKSEFKANWEVDRFFWPEICGAVETRLEAEIATTVSSLRRDCRARDCNVVALTSDKLGAGRTTMSLVLVRELARQGVSTAVVDFDCHRPSLAERLGVNVDEGIESLQHEDVTPSSICVHAVEENVGMMPLLLPIDAAHCVSQVVQEAIVTLGRHYDMVIIDASQDAVELMAQEANHPRFLTIVVNDNGSQTQVQQLAVRVSQQDDWPAGVIQNFAA